MLSRIWRLHQQTVTKFVLVDAAYAEVAGLGGTFSLELTKGGWPVPIFAAGLGVKGEIGSGWYYYQNTLAEADTVGEIGIIAYGAGTIQQNILATCQEANALAEAYTYVVKNSVTGLPVQGIKVWFTTDAGGLNTVFVGFSDTFGVVRDTNGDLPVLDHGTYRVWKLGAGFEDADYPDIETVP